MIGKFNGICEREIKRKKGTEGEVRRQDEELRESAGVLRVERRLIAGLWAGLPRGRGRARRGRSSGMGRTSRGW